MMNHTKEDSEPALCRECRKLVLANYITKKPVCPDCSGKVVFYNETGLRSGRPRDPDDYVHSWQGRIEGEPFVLCDVRYLCPNCGKISLRFAQTGMRFD